MEHKTIMYIEFDHENDKIYAVDSALTGKEITPNDLISFFTLNISMFTVKLKKHTLLVMLHHVKEATDNKIIFKKGYNLINIEENPFLIENIEP